MEGADYYAAKAIISDGNEALTFALLAIAAAISAHTADMRRRGV